MTIQYGWTGCIVKTSDESKTGATPTDDNTLVLTLNASKYYRIRMQVLCWANAAADFRFGFKAGALAAGCLGVWGSLSVANLQFAFSQANTSHDPYDLAAMAATPNLNMNGSNTTTARGMMIVHGLVQSAASSPGTFAFQWCQTTNNATAAKVFAGSYLLYEEFT